MASGSPSFPTWLSGRALPLLVMAAGLALSLGLWQREHAEAQARLRLGFDASLREASLRVEQRMAAHELLLQGVQGFLHAHGLQDPQGLRLYVDSLPLGADFAGLQGLGLAEWRAAPGRAPMIQLEPGVRRNLAALGVDLMVDPLIRPALELARDSGRMALSDRFDLQGIKLGKQVGFLALLPVYAPKLAPQSVEERRAALRAWVVAPVAMPELMASLYGELAPGLRLELFSGTEPRAAQRLFASERRSEGGALMQGQEYLVLGGQTWTLLLQADGAFAPAQGLQDARQVLAAGVLASLLLSLLSWALGSSRERAHVLAQDMTAALRRSEQRWAFALEGAGDGIWDWEMPSQKLSTSPRWKSIMNLPDASAEPNMSQVLASIHGDDRMRVQAEFQHCLDGLVPAVALEYRIADGQGGWRWVLVRGTVVERDAQQRPLRMLGTLSDIQARRESEERVRFMASHDPLTELANRAHFQERMNYSLANARRYHETLGLILLDLDRFKPINDQFGHAVGDQLLQTVAKRLKNAVRETDTVGRIGGDEFVVLLTGPVTRDSAQVVADKIFNQLAMPMEIAGVHLELTCSLGLAIYPEDGQDELSLTKAADDAMYRNKRAGRAWMGNGELRGP